MLKNNFIIIFVVLHNTNYKKIKLILVDAAPMDRLNKWCMRGAKAPNKWGGNPLDSNNACKRPTSPSSSLSWLVVPLLQVVAPKTIWIHVNLDQTNKVIKFN